MSRPPPLSDAVIAEGTEENEVEVDLSTLMFIDRGWLEHHTMNVRETSFTLSSFILFSFPVSFNMPVPTPDFTRCISFQAFMNPSGLMDYFCQRHNPFYDER